MLNFNNKLLSFGEFGLFCYVVDRSLLVMPGYSSSDDALATKLISFYPENVERPSHQAWIMLFEPTNGDLCAVLSFVTQFLAFYLSHVFLQGC